MATITELLEAHHEVNWNRAGRRECACGYEFTCGYSAQLHRAHVAEVLEAHMREREAEAWDKAAECAPEYMPTNPYRKESSDGR